MCFYHDGSFLILSSFLILILEFWILSLFSTFIFNAAIKAYIYVTNEKKEKLDAHKGSCISSGSDTQTIGSSKTLLAVRLKTFGFLEYFANTYLGTADKTRFTFLCIQLIHLWKNDQLRKQEEFVYSLV